MWSRRLLKIFFSFFGGIALILLALMIYVRMVSQVKEPEPPETILLIMEPEKHANHFYTLGNNWFRKSESGLYELYLEGGPFERGVANGKLTTELVQYQEEVFNKQIHRLVPSGFYRTFLKYFIGWFNRNLDKNVPDEYKLEILGVSQAASANFNTIAPAYQRMLNYHAAHDIGHALQNMSLVGCTSFATWGSRSEDGALIIGRNFDFYVGDDFARDKIVAFYNPSEGYKFMMVTFGGMTGVLSGMNDQGLTVTINAAKSDIPSGSATPVSIVAREILQYASTIGEAYSIAKNRKMFVAESFLIGSAKDGRAAIIEKSPDDMGFYESGKDYIICTNHFQGEDLGYTRLNTDHMKTSASVYRHQRVEQLLERNGLNSISGTALILRNQLGLDDQDIGLGNEKSINQLVAHHSIIFQPEKRLVWVSTYPWQLGKFVCYDLNKVFAQTPVDNRELYEEEMALPEDPFLLSPQYPAYVKFSAYRFPFNDRKNLDPDSLLKWNPNAYHAYLLAGDYYLKRKEYERAVHMYEAGLTKEIATEQERNHMMKNLQRCRNRLK